MTRISSTQSIAKQRIHANFVERNRIVVDRASSVGSVTPISPVENNINYSSANHLMISDLLYDKLEELKRDYLDFYSQERNFHQTVDEDIEIDTGTRRLSSYPCRIIF